MADCFDAFFWVICNFYTYFFRYIPNFINIIIVIVESHSCTNKITKYLHFQASRYIRRRFQQVSATCSNIFMSYCTHTRAHIHRVISGYLLRLLESSSIKLSTINNANAILQHDHHYPEEFLTLYLFLVRYGWQPTFMSNINHRSRQRWKIKGRQIESGELRYGCLSWANRARA